MGKRFALGLEPVNPRGPWVIAGAIVVAALILVGAYWQMTADERA